MNSSPDLGDLGDEICSTGSMFIIIVFQSCLVDENAEITYIDSPTEHHSCHVGLRGDMWWG